MSAMRYVSSADPLCLHPMPGQREIRRRPARDFTLRRPHADLPVQEVQPHV